MPTLADQDQKWFGGGYVFGTQIYAPGTPSQPPSILLPSYFATIQEAMVDFTIKTVELRSTFEDPEDVATASRKISGKIVTGRVNLLQLNWLVFGEPGGGNFVPGSAKFVFQEPHTVGASGSSTVTVNNAGTFFEDKGVFYAGTRLQLTPVAGSPTLQGTYSYNPATGVYTFSGFDGGALVVISYRYTTTTGHTLNINNLVMGSARPAMEVLFQNPYDGDGELLLYAARVSKVGFPIKTEDYVKLEIDFTAFANQTGQTAQWLSSY